MRKQRVHRFLVPVHHVENAVRQPGFLRGAKLNFMKLQAANDSGNVDELREFTTPELFADLRRDIDERGNVRQQTDILSLNADLLEVATEGDTHWASVRFADQGIWPYLRATAASRPRRADASAGRPPSS